MSTSTTCDRILHRAGLAASLHLAGLRTASEAVGRDLAVLAPSIIRDLRAHGLDALVAEVVRWEAGVTGRDIAALTALSATTGAL